ncbi:hypothetical protein [uncultured Subdoligranulum sp.]|uniref:hypothetical protein n=1 Tax=uncultured Subdoligranulum sp. TaxID=512298 RepID=UPI00262F9B2E|nr:hypothetical protein [uncultured Subdoligranulum sp.]
MAQTITFDETAALGSAPGGVQRALDKMTAALQDLGTAGSAARTVLDQLRDSLRATAAQSGKTARSLAKFDEIQRLAAPETEKQTAEKTTGGSGKKSGTAKSQAEEAEQTVSVWQLALDALRALWARFWDYLRTYYAPAIAAWTAAWQQFRTAALAVWEPVRTAALALWNNALAPLGRYIATEFLPGVVNSFSTAFAPIVGGAAAAAVTVLGNTFTWLCGLVTDAVNNVVGPALALLLTAWQDLMAGVQAAWAVYGQPLLDGVVLAFQNLTGLLSALWTGTLQPLLTGLITRLGALWTDCLNPLWQQLTLALGAVLNLVLALWNNALMPLATWLAGTLGPVAAQVGQAVMAAASAAAAVVSGVVTSLLAVLQGLADFLTGVLQGDWNAAWNAMAATVSTVWQRITATVSSAANALRATVQGLADALSSLFSGVLSAISRVGSAASGAIASAGSWISGRSAAALPYAASLPLPALAAGAVIPPNKQFLALLGDQRHGTNVEAPLATIQQAVAQVMADVQDSQAAGFEALAALLRELLQAVYGIRLTDEMVGRAAARWQADRRLQWGGDAL